MKSRRQKIIFSNIPLTKDNPMANRHMYYLKIPIKIKKDDHIAEIRSKRGAWINLADGRKYFIGDPDIKIISNQIEVKMQMSHC